MSLEGNFRPVWVLGFPEQPKVYVQVPWLCSLRQVPEQGWSLPRDHFRHDVKIAGQIGKPAEQGRYLTKNEGSKLCLGLFTCSVIFRQVTALPPTSPISPAATQQWSSGIWAELVGKAEKKELVELEPWLNGCPCPLQRNHSSYKIHVLAPGFSSLNGELFSFTHCQVSWGIGKLWCRV